MMMYTFMEAEKLSSLAPELLLKIMSYQDQMSFLRKLKRLSFPSAV